MPSEDPRLPSARDESGPDSGTFRQRIAPDMGFAAASAAARRLRKLRDGGMSSRTTTRIAVLGSSTTSQLTAFVELFLFASDIDGVIYEAHYGLMRQEILDPESELYRFAPQFVVLAGSRRDLSLPPPAARLEDLELAADAIVTEWRTLGRIAHERSGCRVIQNNFEAPAWRAFGNLEMSHAGAIGEFIDRVNRGLRHDLPEWLTLHDLDGLAASVGRWQWGDERYFHLAKLPCAPEHLTTYAHSVAATREVMNSVRIGRPPNLKRIKRAVQSIVDQILNDETSLVGHATMSTFGTVNDCSVRVRSRSLVVRACQRSSTSGRSSASTGVRLSSRENPSARTS